MRLSRRPIDVDLACPGCGYNLRGLQRSASCPECRTPVWAALKRHVMLTAAPEWLARLTQGTRAIQRSLILFYVGIGIGSIVAFAGGDERLGGLGVLPPAASILWGLWRNGLGPCAARSLC